MGSVYFQGPLVLFDSEIAFDRPNEKNVMLAASRSFYLNNVYARNAARIATLPDREGLADDASGWIRIKHQA